MLFSVKTANGLISLPCPSGIDENSPNQSFCQVSINKLDFLLPHQEQQHCSPFCRVIKQKGIFILLLTMKKRCKGSPDALQQKLDTNYIFLSNQQRTNLSFLNGGPYAH